MGLRPANWQHPRTAYSMVDTLVAMIYDKHVTACSCKAGQMTYRYLRSHWDRLQVEMPHGDAGNHIQRIKGQINDPEVKFIYNERTQHHDARHTNGRAEGEGSRKARALGAPNARADGRVEPEGEGVAV